jgi:hypothetical protein
VFRALVGDSFEALPPAVRAIHDSSGERTFTGRCDVYRGASLASRVIAAALRLPRAGRDVPLRVTIRRHPPYETWTRDFAGRRLRSVLRARRGLLEERMGATTFTFALRVHDRGIRWELMGVRALGFSLPLAWFRGVRAGEGVEEGRYRFDVRAELPVAGLLVHYHGLLDTA